jgi:serine/threonine protein kinase
MIRRECVILRDIENSHPHIMPMLSCAELVSESVLLTPFASHGDLSQHVRIGCECLEERDVQRLTSQLMSALAHLHKRRIVHGDIMPKNVFLSEHTGSFLAQLGDFGLAARLPEGQDVIRLENMQGSHGYLPPQMIRHKELRLAGDLFALGVMTFQLLGAHDPFYPASQVWNKVEFDEVCWEPISDAARQFVIELLAVEPEVRGTANGFTRQWLDDGNGVHPCATRGSMSPKPAHDVHFHSLAEARSLWEAVKPQLGGYTN